MPIKLIELFFFVGSSCYIDFGGLGSSRVLANWWFSREACREYDGGTWPGKQFQKRHTAYFVRENWDDRSIVLFSYVYPLIFLFQVTGVVGRAETLSSVFFLAAFLLYSRASKRRNQTGIWTLYTVLAWWKEKLIIRMKIRFVFLVNIHRHVDYYCGHFLQCFIFLKTIAQRIYVSKQWSQEQR